MTSLRDLPIEKIEEALSIRKEIETLQSRLNTLVAGKVAAPAPSRKSVAPVTPTVSKKPVGKPVAPAKKKTGLTPEGRAKLSESMRARWAAKKANG